MVKSITSKRSMLRLNHKNLDVWESSMGFISRIYVITESFPTYELYGLTSQLRRAAVSVASNIAEGAARTSLRERKRFFEIARSSLVEIDTQLLISVELGFLSKEQLREFDDTLNKLFAMLTNLIANT